METSRVKNGRQADSEENDIIQPQKKTKYKMPAV
jgi:hypothetical protein